jgi:hypothetical protein
MIKFLSTTLHSTRFYQFDSFLDGKLKFMSLTKQSHTEGKITGLALGLTRTGGMRCTHRW